MTEFGIYPNDEQAQVLEKLSQISYDGPLHYLNLLAFKDKAEYPADHEFVNKGLSGKDAYNNYYGPKAFEHVTKRGGRLTVLADVEACIIGNGGQWHQVATMEYPTVSAFIDMGNDPDFQAATLHRQAGLSETIVLITKPLL